MARDTWFETVAFCQQAAKKRLPKSVYAALLAASEKGVTVADNIDAFAELGFASSRCTGSAAATRSRPEWNAPVRRAPSA
jgi:hypothetical protein